MSDQSPASEASDPSTEPQTTLAALFDEDPLKLSDRDFDRIIEELRKDRARYLSTGKGTTQSKTKVAKPKEISQEAVDLLSDLGLG